MSSKIIFLISGIVLTLLFNIFAIPLYEALYYDGNFSNAMFEEGMYLKISLATTVITWGLALIYYFAIDSVRFSRWYHWIVMLIAAVVLCPGAAFMYPNSTFAELGYDYSAQLSYFNSINEGFAAILFVAASFSVRWWSTNCRHTPIPE